MAVKQIVEIGHRVLKLRNKKITDFKSAKLKNLIRDLTDTMKDADLIGIAAPQIAESYQVFITQPRKTRARKLMKNDALRVYINPVIIFASSENSLIYEGCGCIPEHSVFGPVKRPREIEVEAYDIQGRKFRMRCNGILARVVQHEYDHLQGIEFLERICDYRHIISWKFYAKNIRNSRAQTEASKITKIEFNSLPD